VCCLRRHFRIWIAPFFIDFQSIFTCTRLSSCAVFAAIEPATQCKGFAGNFDTTAITKESVIDFHHTYLLYRSIRVVTTRAIYIRLWSFFLLDPGSATCFNSSEIRARPGRSMERRGPVYGIGCLTTSFLPHLNRAIRPGSIRLGVLRYTG
jgi:hypothetical protein